MPGLEHVSLPSCTRGDESRLGFGNRTVRFETNHYFDVLRMLNYVT